MVGWGATINFTGAQMLSKNAGTQFLNLSKGGLAASLVLAGLMTVATPQQAYALSDGCLLVNAGALNISGSNRVPNTVSITQPFEPGDQITVTLSGGVTDSYATAGGKTLLDGVTSGSGQFTATSTATLLIESDIETGPTSGSIIWTCNSPGAAGQQLQDTQNSAIKNLTSPTALPGTSDFERPTGIPPLDPELQAIQSRVQGLEGQLAVTVNDIEDLEKQVDEFNVVIQLYGIRLKRTTDPSESEDISKEILRISSAVSVLEKELEPLKTEEARLESQISEESFKFQERQASIRNASANQSNYFALAPVRHSEPVSAILNNISGEQFSDPTDTAIPLIFFLRGNLTVPTGASRGLIGTGQLGVSAKFSEQLVVGGFLLGSAGAVESGDAVQKIDTRTVGFGGGIYGRYNLMDMVNLSLSTSFVGNRSDITTTGTGVVNSTGTYDGTAFQLSASADKTFDFDELQVTPSLGVSFGDNRTNGYTNSAGGVIAATEEQQASIDLGLRVARTFELLEGSVSNYTPWASVGVRAATATNNQLNAGNGLFAQQNANFSIGTGVNIVFDGGAGLDLGANFNNVGQSSQSISFNGKLSIPLPVN